jgi:hypothetical protein
VCATRHAGQCSAPERNAASRSGDRDTRGGPFDGAKSGDYLGVDKIRAGGLVYSRAAFFFGTCAGRRSNFFSSPSACRCALSAFVRFFAMSPPACSALLQ